MPTTVGNIIAASRSAGMLYAERLLKDVNATDFARPARPGGHVVNANHAAFVFGHLSLYAPRIVEQLGGPVASIRPPTEFGPLFAKDSTCRDDPHGTIYPGKDAILDVFFRGYRTAIDTLRQTDDVPFSAPNPAAGPQRDVFPTMGAMLAFYAGGHLMNHLGQLSTWRRMMGLGPA